MKEIKLTDIKGVKVGQYENQEAATGCSVVIVENGATAGVDVRGGGPATRETDLLNPYTHASRYGWVYNRPKFSLIIRLLKKNTANDQLLNYAVRRNFEECESRQ